MDRHIRPSRPIRVYQIRVNAMLTSERVKSELLCPRWLPHGCHVGWLDVNFHYIVWIVERTALWGARMTENRGAHGWTRGVHGWTGDVHASEGGKGAYACGGHERLDGRGCAHAWGRHICLGSWGGSVDAWGGTHA
jgi:hypothetical protein